MYIERNILNPVKDKLFKQNISQVKDLPLVDPAAVLREGVQLVVGDEVGLEVLLPISDTLQTKVSVTSFYRYPGN
jgi:hypothetical protein